MFTNEINWLPLRESYTKSALPADPNYAILLVIHGMPILGGLYYENTDEGRQTVVKVMTHFGLKKASEYGCKEVAFIQLPALVKDYTDYTIDDFRALAAGCWVEDLSGFDDGQLIRLRMSYQANAHIRRSDLLVDDLEEPLASYPAQVWDLCVAHVQEEIVRRIVIKTED